MKRLLLLSILFASVFLLNGQPGRLKVFKEVALSIDTSRFTLTEHRLDIRGEEYLWFAYREETPEVEFRLFPVNYPEIDSLRLLPSGSFTVVDSMLKVSNDHYRLKVRFHELTNSNFLVLTFQVSSRYLRERHVIHELRLFPVTRTSVSIQVDNDELFIGEEKVFKVDTDNIENIHAPNVWTSDRDINYKFTKSEGQLYLHLLPNRLGVGLLEAGLKVKKPSINKAGRPEYSLPPLSHVFIVKPAKLAFLNINLREVSLNDQTRRQGVEIELDYDKELIMHKTYRLEAREESGGALTAEIFTRQVLANGRTLCWLRLYDYHRRTDGYLYIKDGDDARYITNIDIVPETKIESISLRREGQDWRPGNAVYPGESVEIRLEGQSLHRAEFRFDGMANVKPDSLIRGEQEIVFSGRAPLNIDKRTIQIFNGNQRTGQALQVREFSRPRSLDFVYINYGNQRAALTEIDRLVFISETLPDITIDFDPAVIDQGRLFGEQHLEIEVQVLERGVQLVDTRAIPRIIVCPDESSPRYHFYDQSKSRKTPISLNEYLRRKTFDLDIWTSIRIKVKHREDKYGEDGMERTVEFIIHRPATFNIDVSFPAGLLVKRLQEPGFGNLGGISLAMMAQFSFFKSNAVAKPKPYKFGVGFLAFDAFNFTDDTSNRDVGLVALASLYPIQTKETSRLSFPLFAGMGYFLADSKWFLLIGPGIRVRL